MGNPIDLYSPMQTALALLQPTVSVAQKRADANQNLALQTALTQSKQQDAEAAKQQALINQQRQAQLMAVPFLEKDQERWRLEVDRIKAKIRNRVVNDFGGDDEAYARTMLDQDIQGLALDAQKSPLYSAALERRSNFLQAQKDGQDGKIYRSVSYKLTNGQQKTAPWDEAYLDFNNGKTEELPYNGGFKVDGKWRKHFDEVYSPRVDKLGKFKPDKATPQEIAAALVATEGLTGADAMEYLRRTGPMLSPVYYKFDPRDPYREEQLRQGWANVGLGKERNRIARERNAITKKASAGQIDMWDATFNNQDNIITRDKTGAPSAVNVSLFDPEMKSAGSGKLQGFTGKKVGEALMAPIGATYNKKTDTYTGGGGQAYVAVRNSAGGLDMRATDLTGLQYQAKPGNVYRYEDPNPSEYERATGRKAYRHMLEQTILISSDEAKRARAGKLFEAAVPWAGSSRGGLLGNSDSPTGKGAYSEVQIDGKRFYKFKILQPVDPTMLDRQEATYQHMNTQTKTGQAVMYDADDDLNYLP
jgi:hypothetical protein